MWLNEGFATFMAAAFMEQRFGRDEYLRTVEAWRSRYSAVREAGHDRSLVFPDWNRPTADDRTLGRSSPRRIFSPLKCGPGRP
jgi:aminopeptidase N